jgi:hypothetical protein
MILEWVSTGGAAKREGAERPCSSGCGRGIVMRDCCRVGPCAVTWFEAGISPNPKLPLCWAALNPEPSKRLLLCRGPLQV